LGEPRAIPLQWEQRSAGGLRSRRAGPGAFDAAVGFRKGQTVCGRTRPRLGAIGDIRFACTRGGLADAELLVIAADNLFEFSLDDYVAFWRRHAPGSAIAVHRLADASLASLYGVVELDADDRVVGLEEKPERPRSDLVSTATYLFSREHLGLIERFLDEGNAPDPPGGFLTWLCAREPVYGFRFSEEWLDIGELSQLLAADNRYRERSGLPLRSVYSLA